MRRLLFTLAIIWGALHFQSCHTRVAVENPEPGNWLMIDTPVEASLRGLSPVTEHIVWASGANGTWLRTTDGGKSWKHGVIDGMDTVDFRDIEAFSASTAIAVSAGQPAVIYRTTDGGDNWQKVYQGREEDFLNGMAFKDDKIGYAYGDPINGKWTIIKTIDGGETWIRSENPPKAVDGEAGFAASGSIMVVDQDNLYLASGGKESNIYYSHNRGDKWAVTSTPMVQGEASQGIFSLTIIDNSNIIAVGGDFQDPSNHSANVVLSHDNGLTWEPNKGNTPSGYRSGVAYYPRLHWVIAVGPTGTDFSANGGESWENLGTEGFHTVKRSKSNGSIWASGADGKIATLEIL
ncbi:photosystem II stability/assembly factor-like protein [Litoribacter alkaliphilus]|uniref:Photosystem II stability/assembly factor-like protein n=1 Tax=Litoribacter ruber TaxID=702568 RepID=A0AAP2CGU8_9BACT|nr:YCF48-related protein [Litoribacter alkaliphilus]MBS9523434.1 photosystem II stability/assembly factor-like protein [Litoribacter alkaliphilus]